MQHSSDSDSQTIMIYHAPRPQVPNRSGPVQCRICLRKSSKRAATFERALAVRSRGVSRPTMVKRSEACCIIPLEG